MKISFIITYHNGVKYITECVESLYRQNMLESDFEVILIDDKSEVPEALEVIEKFKGHSNYKVIHNKTNLKQGESRNIGLRVAEGNYVWFIDQDDYIPDGCARKILDSCVSRDLDFLIFNFKTLYEDDYCLRVNNPHIYDSGDAVMTGLDYLEQICDGLYLSPNVTCYVWNKIFKKSFLDDNNLFFPPTECEDNILVINALLRASRVASVDRAFYVYRVHAASFMNTVKFVRGYIHCDSTLYLGSINYEASKSLSIHYPKTKDQLYICALHLVNSVAISLVKKPKRERREFFDRYEKYCSQILRAKEIWGDRTLFAINHKFLVVNFPLLVHIILKTRNVYPKME